MSFAPIIGQDAAISLLRRLLAADRLPHALLFVGPEGVGRHKTAIALAQALLCSPEADAASSGPSLFGGEEPAGPSREGPDGCGACAACRRVLAGQHADLHILTGSGVKGDIQVEPTRELITALQLHSVEGGAKVAIVDPADRMNREAANTLLKTLEEPPRNTTLILVARERSLLLPTIVSRCQVVRFGSLDRESLHRYFATIGDQSAFSENPEIARIAVALSGGSIGKALAMAEGELSSGRQALRNLLKGLERSDNEARLKWASDVADLFKQDSESFEIAFEG
ncbi:MAG: DNA polymerase III subunit, partial [Chrysiogenetes bacterium]|nr:DNA polymerase III subunit [Chrysiogenetes bacterium]